MLVCRACNTRYENGMGACPSCGRKSANNLADSSPGDSGRLPPSAAAKRSRQRAKSPSQPRSQIELDESAVVDDSGSVARRPGRNEAKSAPPTPLDADAEQVKAMLSEQPGLLERGLGIYANEAGEPLGDDFTTPVGSIDLLCRDRKGGFVVVHIPAADEVEDSVSAMLRRMGWVRRHLVEGGEDVRGVVVLEQLPEHLAYAAAGAAGAIAFKGFRLALTFHDLDA
jgi:hypothetical protein